MVFYISNQLKFIFYKVDGLVSTVNLCIFCNSCVIIAWLLRDYLRTVVLSFKYNHTHILDISVPDKRMPYFLGWKNGFKENSPLCTRWRMGSTITGIFVLLPNLIATAQEV